MKNNLEVEIAGIEPVTYRLQTYRSTTRKYF